MDFRDDGPHWPFALPFLLSSGDIAFQTCCVSASNDAMLQLLTILDLLRPLVLSAQSHGDLEWIPDDGLPVWKQDLDGLPRRQLSGPISRSDDPLFLDGPTVDGRHVLR